MEPLHPSVRQAILDANADISPAELDEYEQLLSLRSDRRPTDEGGDAMGVAPGAHGDQNDDRIAELYAKLFPGVGR